VGAQGLSERRQGHGTGSGHPVDGERHVHRPVPPAPFAELPGAVERIDDPHPLHLEAPEVVAALLGQHAVAGHGLPDQVHQQVVGQPVALVADVVRRRSLELGPDLEEQLPGSGRGAVRERVVLRRRFGGVVGREQDGLLTSWVGI
jgi:hypothetical protein